MTSRFHRHIFLIEGPIGAGKTSLAMHLAQALEAKGVEARAFLEFDSDHPIRTEQVDLLSGREPEAKAYGPEPWARLAAQCVVNQGVVLLDATLIQNTLLPAFASGLADEHILQLASTRLAALAKVKPLIVYLHVDNMADHLERLHESSSPDWSARNLAWIDGTKWAKDRGQTGMAALVAFHEAWQRWVEAWLAQQGETSLVLPAQSAEIATLSQLVLNHAAKPS
jgi:predicted kinase